MKARTVRPHASHKSLKHTHQTQGTTNATSTAETANHERSHYSQKNNLLNGSNCFAGAPSVWCPVCKRSKLLQNKGIIFCACGLRLDVKNEVDLGYLQTQLTEAYETHRYCYKNICWTKYSEFYVYFCHLCVYAFAVVFLVFSYLPQRKLCCGTWFWNCDTVWRINALFVL